MKHNNVAKILNRIIERVNEDLEKMQTPKKYADVNLKVLKENNIRYLYLIQSVLHVVACFPTVRFLLGENYENFIRLAGQKLFIGAFVHKEILKELGIKTGFESDSIKLENKFNPIVLPESAKKIDPIFRFHEW